MELARKLAWGSNPTGVHVLDGSGDEVNSHASATWVLVTFGLVFLLHSLALFSWVSEQKHGVARDAGSSEPAP